MNHLLGASIGAGRVAVGVAAGFKCIPTLVQARSFAKMTYFANPGTYKVCDIIPVGEKLKNYPPLMKPRRYAPTQSWFGSAFTGEVEKRYLDYLAKLDWEPFENHMTHFPRKHRSKEEKWLILEKWAAHVGRKYPSIELMKMRFGAFKKALAQVDRGNSHGKGTTRLRKKCDIQWHPFSCLVPNVCVYRLKGVRQKYISFTPPRYCELAGTYERSYYFEKKIWSGRDNKSYVLAHDNKVYEKIPRLYY